MNIQSITKARANLYNLVDEVNKTNMPIYLKGKRHDAILVSKDYYEEMEATIEIYRVPGLVQKILKSLEEPVEERLDFKDVKW